MEEEIFRKHKTLMPVDRTILMQPTYCYVTETGRTIVEDPELVRFLQFHLSEAFILHSLPSLLQQVIHLSYAVDYLQESE